MRAPTPFLDQQLTNERFRISVVTEAEIRFGLARPPQEAEFSALIKGVLSNIEICR